MKIIPEITIVNGCCVTYSEELKECPEIVSHSPRKIAKQWEEEGATFLHVKDADGILSGHIENEESIRKVVERVNIPVEVVGGIHSLKDIETILNFGVERVVIRPTQMQGANYLKDVLRNFGQERIAVSIHAKNGIIVESDWAKMKNYSVVSIMERIAESGLIHIEYENVSINNVLFGLDTEYVYEISKRTGLDLTISGGISNLKELELIHEKNISGVIINKALYDKKIELKQAIELFE